MASFWPRQGPQWDALGRAPSGEVILVEAKAHVNELYSRPMAASAESSRGRIKASLGETAQGLGVPSGHDWWKRFYQYANRLAHGYLLDRLNGIPARLVFLYLVGDADVGGPTSRAEWQSEIHTVHAEIGARDASGLCDGRVYRRARVWLCGPVKLTGPSTAGYRPDPCRNTLQGLACPPVRQVGGHDDQLRRAGSSTSGSSTPRKVRESLSSDPPGEPDAYAIVAHALVPHGCVPSDAYTGVVHAATASQCAKVDVPWHNAPGGGGGHARRPVRVVKTGRPVDPGGVIGLGHQRARQRPGAARDASSSSSCTRPRSAPRRSATPAASMASPACRSRRAAAMAWSPRVGMRRLADERYRALAMTSRGPRLAGLRQVDRWRH